MSHRVGYAVLLARMGAQPYPEEAEFLEVLVALMDAPGTRERREVVMEDSDRKRWPQVTDHRPIQGLVLTMCDGRLPLVVAQHASRSALIQMGTALRR